MSNIETSTPEVTNNEKSSLSVINPEGSNSISNKVILIGDTSVGKTSIVVQIHKGIFDPNVEPTVGAGYVTVPIETNNGKKVDLNIWDTAGQEKFRAIVPSYIRDTTSAIIVCSTDSKESCVHLSTWYDLLRDNSEITPQIYIVLNKIDLEEKYDTQECENFANKCNCPFFKVSATNRSFLLPLFQRIANDVLENNLISSQAQVTPKQSSGCC